MGSKVTSIKPGDLVGVGAQAWSCGACEACAGPTNSAKVGGVKAAEAGGWEGEVGFGGKGGLDGGNEQYCTEVVETYVSVSPNRLSTCPGACWLVFDELEG